MHSNRIHVTTIRFALFLAIHQAVMHMQQFAELGPALLFFGTWIITKDIFLSTMVLIGGVSVYAAYEYATKRKLRGTTHLYLWSAWVLGGFTLLFRDETFILWKPTIVNWILWRALWCSALRKYIALSALCWQTTPHSPRGLVQVMAGAWVFSSLARI